MSVTKEEIITAVDRKIGSERPGLWFIGITTNARKRLFEELRIDEINGKWLYGDVQDNHTAIYLKNRYLEKGVQSIDENTEGNIIFVFQPIT